MGTERDYFLCGVMPGKKVYDSMDVQGCGDKVATQMGDDPEDQDDPLPPQSGDTKDKGKQPARIAYDRNYGFTARNNDKNYKDAMTGASSHEYQLPVSFFKSTAGRLRDVTTIIGARTARTADITIGTDSRAQELNYSYDTMTFKHHDGAIMIGA